MLTHAAGALTGAAWFGGALGAVLAAGLVLIASAARRPQLERPRRERGDAGLLRAWLVRAAVPGLTPTRFVGATVSGALSCGALAAAVFGVPGAVLVAGCGGGVVPAALVGWRTRARRAAARAAWPDVVDHLVAAVRSGVALPEAVAALAQLGPESTRADFLRFGREYRATGDFAAATALLKTELADPVFDRIAETLKMAREVGGTELVAVLRSLATALREDVATRGELQARQTWVVNAARLGVAAPWLVLALLMSRPEGRTAYGTPLGTAVIAGALGATVTAYRVMIVIGRLPAERRWFR
ncbi:type II secretion system F family protein [Gryllotalpicola reticulitermitis]|uniref:Type II secretion system F family protein n=1 Tax=Gryllotalpicola reticulitermitis TaxID=1184153 RepID=A0ABV8QAI5_9MICO